jgi:hypothetical protein
MSDKLDIKTEMAAFDKKDRNFYDNLTDDEKKKFSPYMMIRWGASVEGDSDLQAYYLMSTNENLNKNFFNINTTEHKKFQWLMATTVSPGMGKQFHKWLAAGKKDSAAAKLEKFLREIYPQFKDDEIALLAEINTKDDLKQLARLHGWDDKKIKEYL